MRALILLLAPLLAVAPPAHAQEATPLPASLPAEVAEAILARPDRFADLAADLIHGHGTGGAITPAAIDTAIAIDRAYLRTRALRPFHEADLDADGTLTTAEAAARAATLSAPGRARLLRQMTAADADADGTLSPTELRTHAEAEVARASRPLDEGLLRAAAAFDSNADGQTALAEITRAMDALATTD
ncbi:hypothetical protein [Paragemmobacter ruber]|uniref:EF-hand domain-containing protein n=1 Tax=Paragemmobacter ruber TaxID=1985673 RepID=A0ABW9Y1D2_9RHOB|nr:hypothetical protein [Rhodobacter ruber]NBE06331.1 hypothetical protein [Rhodobacter ruber]